MGILGPVAVVVSGHAPVNHSLTTVSYSSPLTSNSPFALQVISEERLDVEIWNSKPSGSWQKQVQAK